MTETFRNEQDAKDFAKTRLTDGSNVTAGTLMNRPGFAGGNLV
jgi:hypothetical protein